MTVPYSSQLHLHPPPRVGNPVVNSPFRHEIAFILGQLSDPHSIPALIEVLKRPEEAEMVRHEAAEALGGIPTGDGGHGVAVLEVLREWAAKEGAPQVVRDSCVVAVDMWEVSSLDTIESGGTLIWVLCIV